MKRFDVAIVVIVTALVTGGLGFWAGHATAGRTAAASSAGGGGQSGGNGYGGGAGGGGFRRGGFGTRGTVSAVSGNTITVNDMSGATKTVNVSSSTTYLNGADRTQASQSDVTTGTTILATGQTASDGSITATRVIINPPSPGGFGGGQNGGGAPQGSSGTSVN